MAYSSTPRRARMNRTLKFRGIAGLGDASSCGPDQEWDPKAVFPGLPPGQCVPKGTAAKAAAASSGGIWDTIKTIGSGILSTVGATQKAEGQSAAYQAYLASQAQPTNYTPFIVIGGLGLAAVLLLKD